MQTATQQTPELINSILMEMDQEAEATRRLFNIIPDDKISWRPHPKAMSLGELSMHIARIPRAVAELGDHDVAQPDFPPNVEPAGRAEVLATFEESLKRAKEIVGATSEDRIYSMWKLEENGKEVVAMPRNIFWRSVLLNHYYHHRGQLSTYLRTLDIPLPSIYGPSADTNPFA
jgi:uncharacterized damage-inducible protein DinB